MEKTKSADWDGWAWWEIVLVLGLSLFIVATVIVAMWRVA